MTAIQAIVATGYIRLGIDYLQLANAAGRIGERAKVLVKNKKTTQIEAVKLLHDYHILRSKLPLIPEWVWRKKQDEINKLWLKFNLQIKN